MTPLYTHAAAAALAAVLAFGGAWQLQAWRYGAQLSDLKATHAATLHDLADKTAKAYDAVRAREGQIQAALAQADQQHQQELTHAKTETDRLRACVRAGTCGVRLVAAPAQCDGGSRRPEDAAATSLDPAGPALDAGVSERVLDLRDAIAADSAALGYLQEYARQCALVGDFLPQPAQN